MSHSPDVSSPPPLPPSPEYEETHRYYKKNHDSPWLKGTFYNYLELMANLEQGDQGRPHEVDTLATAISRHEKRLQRCGRNHRGECTREYLFFLRLQSCETGEKS